MSSFKIYNHEQVEVKIPVTYNEWETIGKTDSKSVKARRLLSIYRYISQIQSVK